MYLQHLKNFDYQKVKNIVPFGFLSSSQGLEGGFLPVKALHTDNKYWALLDIYDICCKNGGYLK